MAEINDFPLRSCGDAVRMRARTLGIPISQVPDKVHEEIDAETARWVAEAVSCIVEGRFLDAVLAGVPEVVTIKLTATKEVRVARGRLRTQTFGLTDLDQADREDDIFRERIYAERNAGVASHEIDTSAMSVDEVVERIQWILR